MNISELTPAGMAFCGFGVMLTKQYDPNDVPPRGPERYERKSISKQAISADKRMLELLKRLPDQFSHHDMEIANEKGDKLYSKHTLRGLMGNADKFVVITFGKFKRRIYTKRRCC